MTLAMNSQISCMSGLSRPQLLSLSSVESVSLPNRGLSLRPKSRTSRRKNLAVRSCANGCNSSRVHEEKVGDNIPKLENVCARPSGEKMPTRSVQRKAAAELLHQVRPEESTRLMDLIDLRIAAAPSIPSQPDWWPEPGRPINLEVHDLPHESATTEWWYVNSHLTTRDGREFSLFASFFRNVGETDEISGEIIRHAHSLTWAITDVSKQKYSTETLLDPSAPATAIRLLEEIDPLGGQIDPLVHRALLEVYRKGNVPGPDQLMRRKASASTSRLELDYDGNRFEKTSDGRYRLTLLSRQENLGAELIFDSQTPAIRHGKRGVVQSGPTDEGMFYYFMPNCKVEGNLIVDGQIERVREAIGWYDHEFGRPDADNLLREGVAWNWFSAQLSNGFQVTAADIFDSRDVSKKTGSFLVVVDQAGRSRSYDNFKLEPVETAGSTWTSTRTFVEYPVAWQLSIPEANILLHAEALQLPSQEYVTSLSKPAFWEGRVNVTGGHGESKVSGLGFVERAGFGVVTTLPDFFKAVTKETQKAIRKLLPLPLQQEDLIRLVGGESMPRYCNGVDREQFERTVIKPIRDVIDRSGKCWRSYASVASIDVVGGNSEAYRDGLAFAELMHVGSLITDDVQDKSNIRRGQPTCHVLYGEPLAINAGSASYFIAHLVQYGGHKNLSSDKLKVRMYEMFFATMRVAHAGQALDIDGFGDVMPHVIQHGAEAAAELERRVMNVHLLKSGAPCASLGRAGAEKGGGSPEQVEGLGNFYESIGLAFQIIDDVLNLRGFEGNLKGSKGEDISAGKITMPVVKAMSRLSRADRQSLWDTIRSRPTDPNEITSVINQLEDCGAIQECHEQAVDLVESAWKVLDPLVPDSDVKIRLRAFGWFVLDRHY